jgi:predicted nucleic acid-binding protein
MIVDSDVLIWASRGDLKAATLLQTMDTLLISAITYMEVVQGTRNKQELNAFKEALKLWDARVVPITETISYHAMFFVESYSLSHSVCLADALIAATAKELELPLLTGNVKHYRPLPGIRLELFNPESG